MNLYQYDRLYAALQFAAKAHDGQYRKQSNIPYITHPMMVGVFLQDANCSVDAIIAGYLHDTLEDTDVTEDQIEQQFGSYVLELVKACSEPDKSKSWEERKTRTIDFLRNEATVEVCYITCADKLHNVRTIITDYKKFQDDLWGKFNRGRQDQKWYYTSLVEVLGEKIPNFPLYLMFKQEVEAFFID